MKSQSRLFLFVSIFLLIGSSCSSLSYAAGGGILDPKDLHNFDIKVDSIQKGYWFTNNINYVKATFTRFNKSNKREYACIVRLLDQQTGEKVIEIKALRKNETQIDIIAYAGKNWDSKYFYYDTHYLELPYYWDLK